jgi:RNA polymerase sigma factor (sigma-70 family)
MSALSAKSTDTRLVEECRRGNEQAWSLLVNRYKNLIFAIPLRYGIGREDAADIFQSVCVDLFNELPRLREAGALPAWLIRVATNRSFRWLKERAQEDGRAEQEIPDETAAVDADFLAGLEREQMVRQAIQSLPPRCREMIGMLFFSQPPLPYSEVAKRLSLAEGSIGFIRGRCLKRMKKILEEKGF